MARIVGLFIDSSAPLEELARHVAEVTQASVTPGSISQTWDLSFGDVSATLSTSGSAGADDAFARRYGHVLSAAMAEGSTAVDSPEVHALRDAARVLQDTSDLSALVVVDMQNRRAPAESAEHNA